MRLAVPVALGRVGIMTMGVVDTVVIGQLAPHELAHQALGWTLPGPALLGGIGLLTGVTVLTARAIGEGRPHAAGEVWRRGLVVAMVAGLLACLPIWAGGERALVRLGIAPALAGPGSAVASVLALSMPFHLVFVASTFFLEAHQRPGPGAVAMWLANVVNLGLNLALVPAWGAVGSAWATVASRLFLAVAVSGYVVWSGLLGHGRRDDATVGLRALLAIGIAAAVSHGVEAGAFSGMSVIAGRLGATAVATFQLSTNLLSLVFMIALGLSSSGAVLVSEAMGRGARREAVHAGWIAFGLTVVAMAGCGLLSATFGSGIARAYTVDAVLIASFAGVMGRTALLMTPDGGQGVADAVLRARGDNWFPTVIRTLAYLVVMPVLALTLAEGRGRGVTGVIEAVLIASGLAYGALLVRFAVLAARDRAHA